jgi:hypothetical protein
MEDDTFFACVCYYQSFLVDYFRESLMLCFDVRPCRIVNCRFFAY